MLNKEGDDEGVEHQVRAAADTHQVGELGDEIREEDTGDAEQQDEDGHDPSHREVTCGASAAQLQGGEEHQADDEQDLDHRATRTRFTSSSNTMLTALIEDWPLDWE